MLTLTPQIFPLFLLHLIVFFLPPSHQTLTAVELSALAAIKDSLTDLPTRSTPFFSTWNFSSPNPCASFSGLICSSSHHITSLTLGNSDSPSLSGSLSPSISNLTQLTQLILSPGLVTGPLPPQLGSLMNLRVISLTNNRFTGTIPSSISSLHNLHTLDLSFNKLTGSIPPGIFAMPELKVLIIASNSLSGELPRTITTTISSLLHLDLKNNMLTGCLPLKMPLSLRYLSVSMNKMWGQLNGLESLSDLVYLDLSMNNFNGSIIPSLFRTSLSSLFLQRNNLSGVLPFPLSLSILPYAPGSVVDLSHNFLTGEIPAVLAEVETLFLNNNHLTGKVPVEYVRSLAVGTTKTLYLQHNYITEFPLDDGVVLPKTLSLCLSYNCLSTVPPVGLTVCPASAGGEISRPASQCAAFNNRGSLY
ncbi:leucine-rich repeat receptor-like serine/threonine-protein kinase SKM1 [Euphorbia lathyris]|uniref:leucine-rich repeat receptor-like serine/threonine-protein kinase SKM1 n=1 Tax=Euphorbia lathyris TaxID=212925 RepID=UPI00331396A2